MTGTGDTRQRILDAALAVIGERGVGGVTNRLVASRAGVSLGSLTYHFASQQEVLEAALRTFVDREVRRITALAGDLGPVTVTDAARVAARTLEEVALGAESVGVLELYLHASREPALRDAARRCWDAYEEVATALLLALGVEQPAVAAGAVVALIAGSQLRWLATGEAATGGLADGLVSLLGAPGPPGAGR